MDDSVKKHRFHTVAGALTFMLMLLLTSALQYTEQQRYHEELQRAVIGRLSQIRAKIEAEINTNFHLTRGLLAVISTQPDLGERTFQKIANNILRHDKSIRNIGLAPDNILKFVYPLEGNERAVGLDYTANAKQWPAVKRSIEQRKTVVAGPVSLVQGGKGFICRTPVFLDGTGNQPDRYWGLASIVIDQDMLFQHTGLYDKDGDISIAVRGKDGLGSQGDIFEGDPAVFDMQPVTLDVLLPEGSWQLAAIPSGGWERTSPYMKWIYGGGFLLAALLGFGVYCWLRKLVLKQLELENERRKTEKTANELRRNEQFLNTIFENIPHMVFIKDADNLGFVRFNRAGEELTGYLREELRGKNDYDFFPVEQADFFVSKDRAVLAEKSLVEIVGEEIDTKLKGRRILHTKKIPLFDQQGRPEYLLGISEDITERQKHEEEQRKLEAQLEQAMELASLGYWEFDFSSERFLFNDQFYKIFHTTAEEVGTYLMSPDAYADRFVHPEDRHLVRREIERTLSSNDIGCRHQVEHRIVYADGKQGYITVQFYVVGDKQNNPVKVYGVNQDITRRKGIEEALEKRMIALTRPLNDPEGLTLDDLFNLDDIQTIQDHFAEATGVASIITGTDGRPITRPSNFCRLCNDIIRKTSKGRSHCFKSDAVIGRGNLDGPVVQTCLSGGLWDAGAAISVGGRHIANWLIGQVRDASQTDEGIRTYAHEIGVDETKAVEAFLEVTAMSREQFDSIARMLFILANQLSAAAYQNVQQARFITEKKRADQEKQELEQQLRQSQKLEAVGRLAGGVAHDFNNMLSVILGNGYMAEEEVDQGSPVHDMVKEIIYAGERSASLVSQLLAFARKQSVSPKVLDLNATLRVMIKMLQRLIGEDIDLTFIPGKNVHQVRIDPSQIDQILANLCINARDAIAGVGNVTIETGNVHVDEYSCSGRADCVPGEYVVLAVSDNGCGMDDELMENIFEPFFTTKDVGEGSGLGLSTVYGVVQQNGGFIDVLSETGKGTTFKIYLPMHESGLAPVQEKAKPVVDNVGHETVLIVEDEGKILKITTKILEKKGYRVIASQSPEAAIQTAQDHTGEIHLLVTDVVMPQMNGRDLAEKIHALHPHMKVLYMSGYTANVITRQGVLDEQVNFIQKPFATAKFTEKVRQVLDADSSGGGGSQP